MNSYEFIGNFLKIPVEFIRIPKGFYDFNRIPAEFKGIPEASL